MTLCFSGSTSRELNLNDSNYSVYRGARDKNCLFHIFVALKWLINHKHDFYNYFIVIPCCFMQPLKHRGVTVYHLHRHAACISLRAASMQFVLIINNGFLKQYYKTGLCIREVICATRWEISFKIHAEIRTSDI